MSFQRSVVLLFLASLAAFGCGTNHGPTRAELREQRQLAAVGQASIVPQPDIDDAELVIARCGRPSYDAILPIYDKLDNGPVRRMIYRGRHALTLEFIPSHPIARFTETPAPFAHGHLPLNLPADSVWRFDDARMQQEEFLTTERINVYLPCASAALRKEY